MKLSIKLIEQESTVNKLQYIPSVDVRRGETIEIVFQLVQDNGHRYIPSDGATVEVHIERNKVAIGIPGWNERETHDYSIKREAEMAFSGDRSIWKLPITVAETQKLASGSIAVTLTEGEKVRKAHLTQAIRIIDRQEK